MEAEKKRLMPAGIDDNLQLPWTWINAAYLKIVCRAVKGRQRIESLLKFKVKLTRHSLTSSSSSSIQAPHAFFHYLDIVSQQTFSPLTHQAPIIRKGELLFRRHCRMRATAHFLFPPAQVTEVSWCVSIWLSNLNKRSRVSFSRRSPWYAPVDLTI